MKEPGGAYEALKTELLDLFARGTGAPLSETAFNDLALWGFRFQCEANPVFGAFVARRGLDPEMVGNWEEIPHLPTQAFKSATLVSGNPSEVEAVFETSGTTLGDQARGRHLVRSLDLYRGSLLPNFLTHLLPEGKSLPLLALLTHPGTAPGSSLSFMMGEVLGGPCGGEGGFFVDPGGGIQVAPFLEALREAEERGGPVLLAGTAFAFVHWLDIARAERWIFHLPDGSRLMETGGFKGRSRTLARGDLYGALERSFGIPVERMVNEYGMTELLSQFYEPVLIEGEKKGLDGRYHRPPPWVRTRALDPLTLLPVPPGEVGILAHLDLANLGSVSAILTEDLGRLVPGGFRLEGRRADAEPRGCSLAMEDFLAGVEGAENGF